MLCPLVREEEFWLVRRLGLGSVSLDHLVRFESGSQSKAAIVFAVAHLHSHFSIVTCRSEHTRICRIPSNSVNAARGVTFESFN